MSIIVYDSNNWVWVALEKDFTGLGLRLCWSEAMKDDGNVRIFVFDGRGGNNIRRTIYPNYKMKRKFPTDNFFENLSFFKELLQNAPKSVAVAEKEGFEGDDVISSICKKFSPNKVVIMSTDKDLTQIPNAECPMANQTFCEKKYVRLYKTLVGDPSDNITGVSGFGKGLWEKLTDDERDVLIDWFKNSSEENAIRCSTINEKAWNLIRKHDEQQLNAMWVITGFFDVDVELRWGDGNSQISEEKLKELLL